MVVRHWVHSVRDSPNRRIQDGVKQRLLCDHCEGRLSQCERKVAEEVFVPMHAQASAHFDYGPWFGEFVASLVWRALLVHRAHGLKNLSDAQLIATDAALDTWRQFLLRERADPGQHELHCLPLDVLRAPSRSLPANINRYILRVVDTDVAASPRDAFVYVKLCKLLFIGFIDIPHPQEWVGTRLSVDNGSMGPRRFVLPKEFGDYLMGRARRVRAIQKSISPRQRERLSHDYRKDLDRSARSESFRAMFEDVQAFGRRAFHVPGDDDQ